jgi:hypothetical protein
MWHYLYFIVLVKVKNPTEFTGPESYVATMMKVWPTPSVLSIPFIFKPKSLIFFNSKGAKLGLVSANASHVFGSR